MPRKPKPPAKDQSDIDLSLKRILRTLAIPQPEVVGIYINGLRVGSGNWFKADKRVDVNPGSEFYRIVAAKTVKLVNVKSVIVYDGLVDSVNKPVRNFKVT